MGRMTQRVQLVEKSFTFTVEDRQCSQSLHLKEERETEMSWLSLESSVLSFFIVVSHFNVRWNRIEIAHTDFLCQLNLSFFSCPFYLT